MASCLRLGQTPHFQYSILIQYRLVITWSCRPWRMLSMLFLKLTHRRVWNPQVIFLMPPISIFHIDVFDECWHCLSEELGNKILFFGVVRRFINWLYNLICYLFDSYRKFLLLSNQTYSYTWTSMVENISLKYWTKRHV